MQTRLNLKYFILLLESLLTQKYRAAVTFSLKQVFLKYYFKSYIYSLKDF